MEHAMRDLEHTLRRQSMDLDYGNLALAYIDDTVLCMPQHAAEAVIIAWQAALQPSTAVPCGSRSYIQDFLGKQKTAVGRRLEAACALAETVPDDQGGEHVSLHIIRMSVLAMHVHLLRALHPTITQPWAADIDGLVRNTFTRITDVPISANDDLFSYPPAEAGLGFTSLRREAATHFVAQVLSDRHAAQNDAYNWNESELQAFHLYELSSGVAAPHACAVASDVLAHTGRRKAVKLLRVPLYKDPASRLLNTPSPISFTTVPRASTVMQRAALAWFQVPRGAFVHNGALRCALRVRLALPLVPPALTCQYTPATTQRLCGHPLD
eukprot:4429207-Amphidinium_carterae.1